MDEVIFVVEEAPEGGYTARALGASIFTEADTVANLYAQVRDAVRCHFEEGQAPKVIRLHSTLAAPREDEPGMHPVPVQQPARPQRLDVALELPPVLRIRRDRNARRRRVGL